MTGRKKLPEEILASIFEHNEENTNVSAREKTNEVQVSRAPEGNHIIVITKGTEKFYVLSESAMKGINDTQTKQKRELVDLRRIIEDYNFRLRAVEGTKEVKEDKKLMEKIEGFVTQTRTELQSVKNKAKDLEERMINIQDTLSSKKNRK